MLQLAFHEEREEETPMATGQEESFNVQSTWASWWNWQKTEPICLQSFKNLGQSDGGLRKLIEDHSPDSDILELISGLFSLHGAGVQDSAVRSQQDWRMR